MVINIKLTQRFEMGPNDTMGRTWAGWDPESTDQELWDHNRGRYAFAERVLDEQYATLSFGGTIRVVARLTGREPRDKVGVSRRNWALCGEVLPVDHPALLALVGQPDHTHRGIRYLPDAMFPELLAAGRSGPA